MNTLYEEQKNGPYRTYFGDTYKEQPGGRYIPFPGIPSCKNNQSNPTARNESP